MTDLPGAAATVLRREASASVVEFRLGPEYPGFDGHFPGDPILPGMCHLDLALRAASLAVGAPLTLEAAERARFNRAVRPGDVLRVSLSWEEPEGGLLRARAAHAVGDDDVAELVLLLRRSAPGDA